MELLTSKSQALTHQYGLAASEPGNLPEQCVGGEPFLQRYLEIILPSGVVPELQRQEVCKQGDRWRLSADASDL